jgi:hypothetical protein
MHMIDVMKKLQGIAEAGYDNEDIQRGIDAAGKHAVTEAQSPAQKAAFQKMLDAKKGDKPEAEDDEEVELDEAVETVEEVDYKSDSGDVPINKMTRQEMCDYLSIYPSEAMDYSDDELRGFCMDLAQDPVAAHDHRKANEAVETESEEIATETVEVPVNELAELMQLAGYTDYAEKIEEYANEPEEDYMDAEEQLIGLSGGLNGPKKMYAAAAGGDNPMDQEPREVTESTFESFYKKYDKFVAELTESEQDK